MKNMIVVILTLFSFGILRAQLVKPSGGGSGGGVTNWNGRTGPVSPATNDYSASQIEFLTDSLLLKIYKADSAAAYVTPKRLADTASQIRGSMPSIAGLVAYADSNTKFPGYQRFLDSLSALQQRILLRALASALKQGAYFTDTTQILLRGDSATFPGYATRDWSIAQFAGKQTSGNYLVSGTAKDTFQVPMIYDSGAVKLDSNYFYAIEKSNITLIAVYAIYDGAGAGVEINVSRNRGGSRVDCLTANYAVTTSYASAGTIQNGTTLIHDIFHLDIRGFTGTAQHFMVVLVFQKVLL